MKRQLSFEQDVWHFKDLHLSTPSLRALRFLQGVAIQKAAWIATPCKKRRARNDGADDGDGDDDDDDGDGDGDVDYDDDDGDADGDVDYDE